MSSPVPESEQLSFGALLREMRCSAGLSQETLAERARLSPGAISSLERGIRRAPQRQTLGLLVEALGLSPSERSRLERSAADGRRRHVRPNGRRHPSAPTNLPHFLTSFHGRHSEHTQLSALLRTRRLITLLGSGGVGKTRFALETSRAHLSNERFTDGVWLIELGSLRDPGLIITTIARALGIRDGAGDASALLLEALRTKRILLILDNCEHLIDACARIAERMLQECADITIVATTREALRIDGESVLRIEPLGASDVNDDALELFADRLVEADADRYATLSPADREYAGTICRRLDGVPLALELAAARGGDLSLAQIAAGLEERFTLLTEGRRTAEERQQSLRGIIDWSFALLTPLEQQVFIGLALFPATFTLEAAQQVCGMDLFQARTALSGLTAKSLVTIVEREQDTPRYRLLETVRAYAFDRLVVSGEHENRAHRFARYFCALATAADVTYGRISHEKFLASVEPELENFRFSLAWTLAQKKDRMLGAELAGSLGWCYRQLALMTEGSAWCEDALRDGALLEPRIAGRLHMALSFFCFALGELGRALDAARRATAVYREARDNAGLAWALTQEVYCNYLLGHSQEARTIVAQAVEIARNQDDLFRLAGALNALAITIPVERAAERLVPLEDAIRCYRASGDIDAIVPIANLAEAYFASGSYEAALRSGLEVVEITRRNGDRSNLASSLTNVAAYALMVDDLTCAKSALHEAFTLMREIGKSLSSMCALQHVGTFYARSGNAIRAASFLGASHALYRDFGLDREFTEATLHAHTLKLLRKSLTENQLQEWQTEGAAWPFERAVSEALGEYGTA
ncbi:MAG: helix-turn-helix domain-containing protein [Candidatus Eremiobacteraeota bacterium]|nr:helix-turn-helix domain-containing protein [Candidatus Eremiobacteraeota bacterium]